MKDNWKTHPQPIDMDTVTEDELKTFLQGIFFKETAPKERKVFGLRGCITAGWVDMDNVTFHCGDEKCTSCNFQKEVWEKARTPYMTITKGNEKEAEHINEDVKRKEGTGIKVSTTDEEWVGISNRRSSPTDA
jgi:hypothetical protein